MAGGRTEGQAIASALGRWLGPDAARAVVRTYSDRVLGCRLDEIGPDDVPRLLDALRPMLETLYGLGPAEHVLHEVRERLR